MALRQIRLGSSENVIQYDDGDFDKSISVEDPIECTAAPVAGSDVLRLNDVGTSVGDVYGPGVAVDSDIAEFDGVTGKLLKDGGLSHATVAGAVGSSHARSHAISSTSDHSDVNLAGLSNNDLMRWDDPSSKWLPKSIAEIVLNQIIAPHRLSTLDMVFNNVVVPVAASSLTIGTDLSERKMECVRISATGAETLTNFLGGVEGQIKILIFSGGNVTLTDGTRDSGKFYLNQLPALTDFVGADGDILALINLTGDGGATTDGWWEELWRVIKVK